MNLRELARGKTCAIRFHGECVGGTHTTVLAHVRRAAAAGMGQKPPDLCGVHACARCHDIIDGRVQLPPHISPLEFNRCLLDGLLRTLLRVSECLNEK